jgi:outer membrane lipoprotein carrier protein
MNTKKTVRFFWTLIFFLTFLAGGCVDSNAWAQESNLSLEQILARLEARYAGSSFAADFNQESTIKAMDITDVASGKVYIKYPGMMRWEYETPDRRLYITDGRKLWVYLPADNQVQIGNAPEFFRDGKGASFLSDITLIRQKFDISLLTPPSDLFYELKLVPLEKTLDVTDIRLAISKNTFTVARVTTYNFSGDETRIDLLNSKFNLKLDDSLFSFKIPKGADVLQMDE